jgi:hypothetical protein
MWQFLVNNYYANILAIDFGIQWVAWVFASFFKTEKFYDFTGKFCVKFSRLIAKKLKKVETTEIQIPWKLECGVKRKEVF